MFSAGAVGGMAQPALRMNRGVSDGLNERPRGKLWRTPELFLRQPALTRSEHEVMEHDRNLIRPFAVQGGFDALAAVHPDSSALEFSLSQSCLIHDPQ
jgi:hypothetical protein